MKYLTRTIIVLAVFCLAMASPATPQTNPEAKTRTFTISGNARLSGVIMKGLPGDPVTDERGYYRATVDYGWSGTVTPIKEGYSFVPASNEYTDVIADQTDENYQAKLIVFTISGKAGVPGVVMVGLPGNTITDENGLYSATVDYGWSGTVIPTKEGYSFEPSSLPYSKVISNLENQNYTAEQLPQAPWQYGGRGWEPPRAGTGAGSSRRTGRSTGDRSRTRTAVGPVAGRKVLVVPDEQVKPEELAAITEDMQIMSHILDERFKETRRVQGVFTDFGDFFGRDNRQTEAIYIQGYGVLFSMEVNFTFSPPPEPQPQQAAEPNEQVDSTWEKAKQQVFSPGETRGGRGSGSTQESDSQMVEELKRDLVTTLKHAANIRGVQPNEWIILTVIGGGRLAGGFGGGGFMMGGMGGLYESSPYGGTSTGGMGGYGYGGGYSVSGGSSGYGGGMARGMGAFAGGMGGFGGPGTSAATVLTIRAKKSDIDAFAKGEQDYEQFRQKVQIFTY
jgi:hypothetical protein